MSNRDDFNGRSLPCLASNKVSGGIFVCRADAPYGSHPSGRAVAASPVKRYLRWAKYRLPFSVRESRLGLGERGGTEPLPTAAAVGCRSAHSLRCLYSTSIARTTDQSALTDGLRRAGSGQRFRPREAKSPIAISESAVEPQTLQGTEVSPMDTLFFAFYHWKECCSPKAVSVVMSAASANVTTATAFAFRSGRDGSEGHRAIADMRCWLAARVDRPLADDSPVQESAGSRQRLCWRFCHRPACPFRRAISCSARNSDVLASHSLAFRR